MDAHISDLNYGKSNRVPFFDDIIVTDSLKEAQKFAEETYFRKKDGEKKMEEKAKEVERKAAEAAASEEEDTQELDDIAGEF